MSNIPALKRVQKLYPRVKTLVDADGPLSITVTEDDQAAGHVLEETECALAVACKRQFRASGAIIGISASYIIRGTQAVRYKTSISVAREIVTFDRHKDFAPGIYSLVPFAGTNRLGARMREYDSGKSSGTKKPRAHYHLTTRVRRKTAVPE